MSRITTIPFDAAALEAVASLLTRKGAEARIGAVWPVIEAVASAIYANGARKEQFFDVKGRERHPAFTALHNGKTPIGRAFRATLQGFAGRLIAKDRALTQEAHDSLLQDMCAAFCAAATPAQRAPRAQADKDAAALARAVETVRGGATVLSQAQADALRAVLATYDTLQHATAPATADAPAHVAPAHVAAAHVAPAPAVLTA